MSYRRTSILVLVLLAACTSLIFTNFTSKSTDLVSLQTLISQIVPNSEITQVIQLEARDYVLDCPSDQIPIRPCLEIVNKGRLKIIGVPGVTRILISNPRTGFLYAKGMNLISFENVIIDYITPPFLQARVVSVSPSEFRIQVDSGYLDFNHPALSADLLRSRATFFWIVKPDSGFLRNGVAHFIQINIRTKPPIRDAATGNWIIRVDPLMGDLRSQLAPGDYSLIGSRIDEGVGMLFDGNENVELTRVTMHSAPHMGIFAFDTTGSFIADGLKIYPKPSSGRLASVVADAIHLLNNRGRIEIKNSYIEGMGDDAINIQAYATNVGPLTGLLANELRVRPSAFFKPYQIGDVIQVVGANNFLPRFGPGGEPRVLEAVSEGEFWRIRLDRNRATGITAGDYVYNVMLAAPGANIDNNYFGPFRGGFRIRSPSARFVNNQFQDLRNNHVSTGVDSGFPMEGPITGLSVNSNNRLAILPFAHNAATISVFRFYNSSNGRHIFSTRSNYPSLSYEGIAFRLSSTLVSSNRALYTCENASITQFLSHSSNCEGIGGQRLLGYISTQPTAQYSRALYRCHKSGIGHFATTNQNECINNGYIVEATMGYVM